MKGKTTAILSAVILTASLVGGYFVSTYKAMSVDGKACASFAECNSLLKSGSVWTIEGDWSGSGKLPITKANVTILCDGGKLQYVTVSGDDVDFGGCEVANSPSEINGIYWTGDRGYAHDLYIHHSGLTGLRLYGSNNTVVENVLTVYNTGGTPGNSDGINCSGGGSDNILINVEAAYNGDDGGDLWTCKNNTIRNSNAHHNTGPGDGNGWKLGPGGGNTVTDNTACYNKAHGFAGNEAGGNRLTNNTACYNGGYGFADWGAARAVSYYSNNNAYLNTKGNYHYSQPAYVVATGNKSIIPATEFTPSYTPSFTSVVKTLTPTPTKAPTITPTATQDFICILYPTYEICTRPR